MVAISNSISIGASASNSVPETGTEPSKADVLRALHAELPLNDFGMPTGIYRTDLLPWHSYLPQARTREQQANPESPSEPESQEGERKREVANSNNTYRIAGFPADALVKAFVPLQYDEGFPALGDGRPFWSRLDFEPIDSFRLFEAYLWMSKGRRPDPEDEDDEGRAADGTRSLSQLAQQLTIGQSDAMLLQKMEQLYGYFHLYYWDVRGRAYDLFRVAQHRKQQEVRAIEVQDDHYVRARQLSARLQRYMDSDEDFWDMMTPKVAVDLMKELQRVERISAGLPAAGPQPEGQQGNQPFEVTFRSIAQGQRGDDRGHLISEDGELLDRALESADATEVLQELIIRSGG